MFVFKLVNYCIFNLRTVFFVGKVNKLTLAYSISRQAKQRIDK